MTTTVDPAAWGSDHVGTELPEFLSGEECLFCHRRVVGPDVSENPHLQSLRPALPDDPIVKALAEANIRADFVLGRDARRRFLKRSAAYGELELSSLRCSTADQIVEPETATWDAQSFAKRCAGCHTSGANEEQGAFLTPSVDCFVCHGDVRLNHSKDRSLALLASTRQHDPKLVLSICGQCHLRGGSSKSTKRPYPNQFVPGDNLFRDFDIDLSPRAIAAKPAFEKHIYENTRDVIWKNETKLTCLSCHRVHRSSTAKHRRLEEAQLCASCHPNGVDEAPIPRKADRRKTANHNSTCDF